MKVSPCRYHNLKRWRATWRSSGKTVRRYFKTRRAAQRFANATLAELKEYGDGWPTIPARDRAELVECWRNAKERGYSVAEACRFWESHGSPTAGDVTIKDLCSKFISAKLSKGLRSESIRLLEVTIDQFKVGREARKAADVSTAEISDWLADQVKWGPWRRRGAIIDLGNLFSWGIKAGLLLRNPVAAIERPTIEHKTPAILAVDRAKALLALCRSKYPSLLPWLVISLFAGLRAGEVGRLRWEDVRETHIELASHQTKGRARRLVSIRPTLQAWLAICRKKNGPICPQSRKNEHQRKLEYEFRKEFGGLAKNVLRHSFISYALGSGETVDKIAMESGNSPDIIFRHYREIVTGEQAAEFWGLSPSA